MAKAEGAAGDKQSDTHYIKNVAGMFLMECQASPVSNNVSEPSWQGGGRRRRQVFRHPFREERCMCAALHALPANSSHSAVHVSQACSHSG